MKRNAATRRSGAQLSSVRRWRRPLLVVEDEPLVANALSIALGHDRVEVVSSVALATARMASGDHGGWLVDICLPDGSGVDAVRLARQAGLTQHAVLVTGLDPRPHLEAAFAVGASVLAKPLARATLEQFLRDCDEPRKLAMSLACAVDRRALEWSLAPQERAVVASACRGVARAAIPLELGLAESTVRDYTTRLLHKAGCTSLSEVVRMVLQLSTDCSAEEHPFQRERG